MSIQQKKLEGFTVYEGSMGSFLEFSFAEMEKCIKVFNEHGMTCLTVPDGNREGFPEIPDLDFLGRMNVRKLIISLIGVKNLNGIYGLKNLEFLRVLALPIANLELDMERMPSLKELEIEWFKGLKNLSKASNLSSLRISKYKSKTKDLAEFNGLKNLEVLKLTQSNVESMDGIESLSNLNRIILAYNKSLQTFVDAAKPNYKLESLSIEVCKKLDLTTLKGLQSLTKLEIINNGNIPSLEPVLKLMPKLEELMFAESEMTESDNSFFLKHPSLKKIYFDNKKHYKYTLDEIRSGLENEDQKKLLLKR